ncbi:MAG TPA: hypothetical protein VGE41_02260 [Verrucomicrobiae bacterium]|jgi:hypothetical protein
MKVILHIHLEAPSAYSQKIIGEQRVLPETQIELMDLSSAEAPDPQRLLEAIFSADSIHVWKS